MHDHGLTTASARYAGRLRVVLVATAAVVVAQVVGALLSGSLALLADVGHAITDVAGLAVALVAIRLATRPATARHTYGYLRAEVLAALLNGVVLLVVAALVTLEAVNRWSDPPEVRAGVMLAFAAVGLVVNVAGLFVLREGSKHSLNLRGAYLEVFGDMLGSLAVIAAALVILTTGWHLADPVASLLVAAFIAPRAVLLLRKVVHVLLEGAPEGVDTDVVRHHLLEVDGVRAVHDLHVWQLTSGVPVMSAHLVVDDAKLAACGTEGVLDEVADCLREHFDVAHSTFQLEAASHGAHESGVHE